VLNALRTAKVHFSVSTTGLTPDLRSLLKSAAGYGLSRVILCDPNSPGLEQEIQSLHDLGLKVLVEATCIEHAELAQRVGADGVVAKGNESGGRIGEETTFILLQRVISRVTLPVWARGGIGLRTAAGAKAAGGAGVVLDWQLALCPESELPEEVKARVGRMDGSETAVLGQNCPMRYRAYCRPGESAFTELKKLEESQGLDAQTSAEALARWQRAVETQVSCSSPASGVPDRLLLIGQDAAFAAPLAEAYRDVKGICDAIQHESERGCRVAAQHRALGPGGSLAQSHGTRYPIVQGPMTRVSDTADFASAVAEAGALPFLALGLLRGPQVAGLLEETERKLGSTPWGIGVLGFLPRELREEQLREARKCPPPFAIIAGGRPDQAQSLEGDGIRTYLHVPSPGLLRIFLRAGSRRLIFEGRECGGHVGPLTSFVLWELMIRVMLDHLAATKDRGDDYHVLFAGGIHDALSASMVAALAAPLTERGVRVGVLLGTSYLFTKEAVATGAIVEGFQQEAIACDRTVLLESGVGHATRCAETPFGKQFTQQKDRLLREGRTGEEIREALELLNLGRLRIASKGLMRGQARPGMALRTGHVCVDADTQRREGLYMIGQVAALRSGVCTMEELHQDVSHQGAERLNAFVPEPQVVQAADQSKAIRPTGQCDIAIIGMSCLFPKAGNLNRYWENILSKVNAISEVPRDRWDCDLYYDSDRWARDKVYSRWGGFLEETPFDPVRYGMPPNSLSSVEPLHLLVLEVVRHALDDAGYSERPFDREHTSVILGAGGGVADLGLGYGFRSLLPHYIRIAGGTADEAAELIDRLDGILPEWTEDSFPGLLLNVAAGRVANRFDLGGMNCTVDAACASSLAAVQLAFNELESRSASMVIVGGADTMQNPFSYLCFSKTQALSPTGQCKTFDESTDGIVIGEGVAIAVLKRAEDALRDGDRVYAVIKGVGSSSDGKDKGLAAPRPAGQIRALKRAYARAGVGADTVGLIEAHGTGTVVGDQTEVESLTRMFGAAGAKKQSCALGSVKSVIGHTKAAAGMAGLLKAALALYHKVLPPTVGVTKPNPKADFPQSPFYVNTETRPWIARLDDAPRRAGVSAFGFGGTNFHTVLEEYEPGRRSPPKHARVEGSERVHPGRIDGGIQLTTSPPALREWPAELFIWRAESAEEIVGSLDRISAAIEQGAKPLLRDLAAAVCRTADKELETGRGTGCHCLAIVADSLDDLVSKLATAKLALNRAGKADASGCYDFRDPRGIYYSANPLAPEGKIAFAFPGQGSQSVDMLRDLAVAYPGVREVFEEADCCLINVLDRPLSSLVFPQPRFTDDERRADEAALTQTNVAQPAMGAADVAMYGVLTGLDIRPDLTCGHSYGEYVALWAAGVVSFGDLIPLSEARGRFIMDAAREAPGTMAAVSADESTVARIVDAVDGVVIANINAPAQTVISGTEAGVEEALKRLSDQGVSGRRIRVSCAFHSSLVNSVLEPLRKFVGSVSLSAPQIPVFSNTIASPYPSDPAAIRARLVEHLVKPVRFADEVRAMYDAGARVFVEVGPGSTLSGLIERTLEGRSFIAVATDQPGRNGLLQLVHALAQLAAAGVVFDSVPLFAQRTEKTLDLNRLVEQTKPAPLPPTTWMINGARAVPLGGRLEPTVRKRTTPVISPSAPTLPAPAPPVSDLTPLAARAQPHALTELDGHDPVLSAHHRLMAKFLDTQKSVMCAYLKGAGSTTTGAEQVQPDATTAARSPWAAREATPLPTSEPRPAVESPGPSSADESSPPRFTRQELVARLVNIVSDRTGYPPEMLDIELDLEADLGIDSIKRLEIIGALQSDSILPDQFVDAEIEALAKLKTLGAIVDWIRDHAVEAQPIPPSGELQPVRRDHHGPAPTKSVPRMLLETVECETLESDRRASHDGVVVITDDERGVASSLAEELTGRGLTAVIIAVTHNGESDGRHPRVNLTDPRAAREFVERIRSECGSVSALIHLLPLGDHGFTPADHPLRWDKALNIELNSLFNLVRHLESDLRQDGSGCVIAATRMGGTFASAASALSTDFRPVHGGVCGFVKALACEWTDVTCKALDFELDAPPGTIVSALLDELDARDGIVEVGYQSGRRVALRPVASPVRPVEVDGSVHGSDASRSEETSNTDFKGVSLCADSVVLITGGARGITAEVAKELAERFKCMLVLMGRSPLPPEHESPQTAHLSGARELKGALLREIEASGEKPTPARVETLYKHVCREREIRANLAAMRRAGANVEYHAVDVTDGDAFGALIDELYDRLGRLDGVIHGAGVIEDKLIRDKTPESFQRVVSPKVVGAEVLASKLRSDSLGFLFFFSSTTARYGNRGQCDYAAANEVLNKLAVWLNGRWPGRVASLNWGPWESGGGMVSPELAKQLEKAGISLISPSAGRRAFVDELLYGRKEEAEVILSGPLGAADYPAAQREESLDRTAKPGQATPDFGFRIADRRLADGQDGSLRSAGMPLLSGRASTTRHPDGSFVCDRELDPSHDLYLTDHQLDGKPVMPMAIALELLSEVVVSGWPDLHLTAFRELRVLCGIWLEDGPSALRVVAATPSEVEGGVDVNLRVESRGDRPQVHYTVVAQLRTATPDVVAPPPWELLDGRPMSMSIEEVYERLLFHGPLFAGIAEIEAIGRGGVIGRVLPSSPQRLLAEASDAAWLIDPVVVDSALQMGVVWVRTHLDMTPLPSRFSRYHYVEQLGPGEVPCQVRIRKYTGGSSVHADLVFFNAEGKVIGWMEDLEVTCSKALNRLAEAGTGSAGRPA